MSGIKFTVNTRQFKKDLEKIDKRMRFAGEGAEHALAIQMAKDTEQYVPKLTGSLRDRTQVNGDTIIYPGPYARFLYNGKLMIDPRTGSSWAPYGATKQITGKKLQYSEGPPEGKAQSHWFEASKAQNLPKWKRVAGRVVQREFPRR